MVMWRWVLASARRKLTSTSIGEERRESVVRVLQGETDAMGLGRGIFATAIQLMKESSSASRGGAGGGGGIAAVSFLEFFFVFDLDFDFGWLSSQHFVTLMLISLPNIL